MANEKPATVTVEALQYHTYNGKEYHVGDTYDIDEQYAESVAVQGKAVRVDRVAVAKKADKAAAETVKHQHSTAVKPMTTADMGVKPKASKARKA